MGAADPEHVAFAFPDGDAFDIANAVTLSPAPRRNGRGRRFAAPFCSPPTLTWCEAGVGGRRCPFWRYGSSVHSFGRYSARSMNA